MKIFPYILILLVTSAFILPKVDLCSADAGDQHDCCASATAEKAMDHNCSMQHKAPLPEEDECPPSCHCLCCVVAFLPFTEDPAIFPGAPGHFSPAFTGSDHLFDFHNKIWQPPRLG